MKMITLALMALTATLPAQTPAPAKSTVKIVMTKNFGKIPKMEDSRGHNCWGDVTTYSLEPTFVKGLDATSTNLVLNIYHIGERNASGVLYISKPVSQIIYDAKSLEKDDRYKSHKWRCEEGDCARRKREGPPEWFAEVLMDGKPLCTTRSKSSGKYKDVIETRDIVTEVTPKP